MFISHVVFVVSAIYVKYLKVLAYSWHIGRCSFWKNKGFEYFPYVLNFTLIYIKIFIITNLLTFLNKSGE